VGIWRKKQIPINHDYALFHYSAHGRIAAGHQQHTNGLTWLNADILAGKYIGELMPGANLCKSNVLDNQKTGQQKCKPDSESA
jgi:hypothetical protein